MLLEAFFALVHPGAGWRCLFTLPDRRHYWFDNDVDLARAALHLDAKGLAVFHSCAVFSEKSRKQASVIGLQCLWMDIDAGTGKPYASAGAAYQALKLWLATTGLPEPLLVASGGGLHVYWPLAETLTLTQWQPYAEALRALAVEHGLEIDPGSTIDAARILRPPGTHNRKLLDATGKKTADVGGPPRPVVGGSARGPYPLSAFASLFRTTPAAGITTAPAFMQGIKTNVSILNVGDFPEKDSDPVLIAARCAQVSRLQGANGALPEPEWYAVLGVLAHCGDAGRAAAHEWSSGDARYRAADTNAKLDQYLANAGGPTTCERFGQLVNGPCLFCPSAGKITSPIQLGREVSTTVTAPTPATDALPALPSGFRWKGSRLTIDRAPTDDDPRDFLVISQYPVVIDDLQEMERAKTISMVLRSWEPMQQGWRDFILNNSDLVSTGGPGKVAAHGVVINAKRWPDFVQYTNACIIEHRGSKHYGTRYEQFGWKTVGGKPAFVVGLDLLKPNEAPTTVRGSDEVARRGADMTPTGDAAAWAAAASQMVAAPGMEGHAFLLLAAFAAPLHKFTEEPGAPLAHGRSKGSGNGKTAILQLGASVYGEPQATSIIARDTIVAKFITLGTLCNLPIFFDELRFPTPEETKDYVLQATLGRDKQRGKVDGGIRSDQLPWSTIHISASNPSLTDTLRSDGELAQAARVFEFTLALPEGTKTTTGAALLSIARANSGTAGRVFIQAVLDNYAEVAKAVPERMKFYEEAMRAGPDERFNLRLLACVDVAARLVQKLGLLAIDTDKIMAWALSVQKDNAQRSALEAGTDAAATLSQMVNDFIPHTLVVEQGQAVGKPTMNMPPNKEFRGPLWGRVERQGRKLLFEISAVRKWMQQHNYSFTEIQKELLELHVLSDARTRRTLGAGTTLSLGQVWCWAIDGAHPLLADIVDQVVVEPSIDNVVHFRHPA